MIRHGSIIVSFGFAEFVLCKVDGRVAIDVFRYCCLTQTDWIGDID